MKILIDNGHGKNTPGKRSPDESLLEYKWNREVACMICDILLAEGYDAELLVPEIEDIPLPVRRDRANLYDKKSTVLVSIHVNACASDGNWGNAQGWAIYTTKGITVADRLAQCIWDAANDTFEPPQKVRSYSAAPYGRDFEADFYILLHSFCPAVLIENFFMDNKADCAYLLTDAGKATCAEVALAGIKKFLAEW